jgi:hypothetical protein
MMIDASPHPEVVLHAFDRGQDPTFIPAVARMSTDSRSLFVVLENKSDRDIIVFNAVWITVDADGKSHKIASACDGLMTPASGPAVRAGARMLLGPNLFIPETFAADPSGTVGGSLDHGLPSDRAKRPVPSRMVIDSIIFSDGTLVGPDLLRLADEVVARPKAARAVATVARRAMSSGEPIAEAMAVFTPSRREPPSGSDQRGSSKREIDYQARYQARWSQTFAHNLVVFPHPSAYLRYLETIPAPPEIKRPIK